MIRLLVLLVLLCSTAWANAAGEHAVVRIPSHGCSATVIWTGQNRSMILGCAHAFEGRDRGKPMTIDVPVPAAVSAAPRPGRTKLIAVDYRADLSLIELGDGPLPYVAPVAPPGYRPGRRIVAVGYDEMRLPPQNRPTQILREEGGFFWTRERPWHGRSGGGLIDTEQGWTVGVCHAYTGPSNHRELHPGAEGMYVSSAAICAFLQKNGWASGSPATGQAALPQRGLEIPREYRVPNRTGQQCAWVSLATLARYHGIARGAELARHGGLAAPGQPEAELRRLHIRFRSQLPPNRDTAILRESLTAARGVMVGLGGRHAVVAVGLDGDRLTVIENTDPQLNTRIVPLSAWDGWAIELFPDGGDGAAQQSCPGGVCPNGLCPGGVCPRVSPTPCPGSR